MIDPEEKDFLTYRENNKHMRFYEALLNFSGADKIIIEKDGKQFDTKYWQDVSTKNL